MDRITAAIAAAEQAVTNRYGPAYAHIAGCAAVAARTATVDEYQERHHAMAGRLRAALHRIAVSGGADITGPLGDIKTVIRELEA